jgi:hypothetical protein
VNMRKAPEGAPQKELDGVRVSSSSSVDGCGDKVNPATQLSTVSAGDVR